jgi:hypothetical protein
MHFDSFVSVFGADAKNKEKTVSRQYEEVVDDSGIPLNRFTDMRGNHDKYGVPPSSTLDYFPKYSISAALNRSNSLVQSITVEVCHFLSLCFQLVDVEYLLFAVTMNSFCVIFGMKAYI